MRKITNNRVRFAGSEDKPENGKKTFTFKIKFQEFFEVKNLKFFDNKE